MKICEHCGRIIPVDHVHTPMNSRECVQLARNVAEAAPRCGNCGTIEIPSYQHRLLVEGCCEIVRLSLAEDIERQLQQQRSDRGEPSTAL
jgi:hypothetical protein